MKTSLLALIAAVALRVVFLPVTVANADDFLLTETTVASEQVEIVDNPAEAVSPAIAEAPIAADAGVTDAPTAEEAPAPEAPAVVKPFAVFCVQLPDSGFYCRAVASD